MGKKTYFISDLHLGAHYFSNPLDYERRVVRFLDSIADDVDELFLLGDILDYWYEYRTVVPRGFTRFFGTLARMADSGVKITWFIGNHDIWLFDYLRDEIGLKVIDGYMLTEIKGKRFFLSHGDGLGKLPPLFRAIRALFRNRMAQRLYSAIHPRWTVPFAYKWSSHSRDFAHYEPQFEDEPGEPLIAFCREYQKKHPGEVDYFIFGHRHVLVDYPLGTNGAHMIILGDWIRHFSYGVFDGEHFTLHCFEA